MKVKWRNLLKKKVSESLGNSKKDVVNTVKSIMEISQNYLKQYYVTDFSELYTNINTYDYDYFNAFIYQIMVVPFYQSLGDTLGYKKW